MYQRETSVSEVSLCDRSKEPGLVVSIGHVLIAPPSSCHPNFLVPITAREIGYLFGAYKRYRNEFAGVLTGKGIDWGVSYGSAIACKGNARLPLTVPNLQSSFP